MLFSMSRSGAPRRLWRVPAYLPYVQQPLTDAAIVGCETALGVGLPTSYIEALFVQNGGYLATTLHPSGDLPVDFLSGIGGRFPALERKDWADAKAMMAEDGFAAPAYLEDLLPFSGDGSVEYCLDYHHLSGDGEPSVTYVDCESAEIRPRFAADFAIFLSELSPSIRRPALGLVTNERDANDVAAGVAAALHLSFDDRGEEAQGVRTFRFVDAAGATVAWLTANWVRHGFVPLTDPNYHELRALLPERVAQYPEHPDCAYILALEDLTPAGQADAIEKLRLTVPARSIAIDLP